MLLPGKEAARAGVLRPWPAMLVTLGVGDRSAPHAHHCWHLVVARRAGDRLSVRAGQGRARAAPAVLTAPDVTHAIAAAGLPTLIAFIEPESELGAALGAAWPKDISCLPESPALEDLRARVARGDDAQAAIEAALPALLGLLGVPAPPPGPRHPAIRRALRLLKSSDTAPSLTALAAATGLSAGRFMHAFTETMGLPLRPYLRWLKVERAALAMAGGASLSDAAHAAGFADAAHMSRTFRRMFGTAPSRLQRGSQSVHER